MGSSKEDDEAGGASGGKSKPGVATVENSAPAADSQDLKNIDQDEVSDGSQNPLVNDYMQGASSSYAMSQQSQTEDYDDSRFFDESDNTTPSPVVHFIGDKAQVTSLVFFSDPGSGETQFKTQSIRLTERTFYLDAKIKHVGLNAIRLKMVKSGRYINLYEIEFKNNFSLFNRQQKNSVVTLRNSTKNEWDDPNLSKPTLDNVREQSVLPTTTTSSRFQLRSPYFTGQQAYFTGQQAYFLRRGYRGW